MPRHLHIAPQPDLAPELLLAALVDLGASPEALRSELLRCGFPGGSALDLEVRRTTAGVEWRAPIQADVCSLEQARSWAEDADVAPAARRRILATLGLLAASRVDAGAEPLALVAACALALEVLDVATVTADPLPLSRVAPRPATLALLRGAAVRGVPDEGETPTPLGAALAVSLSSAFGPLPPLTLEGTGLGRKATTEGGWRRLQLYLGRSLQGEGTRESLVVLEANLDDLTAEILATLPETCLEAGALDAWLTPVLMKKGRPGHCLHALCGEVAAQGVEEAIFRNSSTLGVRRLRAEREALTRTWEEVETPWGNVRIKSGFLAGESVNRAPEFEDCRARARQAGVPLKEVYAAALAARRR